MDGIRQARVLVHRSRNVKRILSIPSDDAPFVESASSASSSTSADVSVRSNPRRSLVRSFALRSLRASLELQISQVVLFPTVRVSYCSAADASFVQLQKNIVVFGCIV